MDNNDVLQTEVSDVYQKALMSVPESVTSVADAVNDEFINNFITFFKGSRLDGVSLLDASNEDSRQKVRNLFNEIEKDLYIARNSDTSISTLSGDMNTLRMYLEDRKQYDDSVKDAFHNVQNMAGADVEAADLLRKVYEKKQEIRAFRKQSDVSYDKNTREGIRQHFFDNGLLKESMNQKGQSIDVIDQEEMRKRPSEVEELMNDLMRIVEGARSASAVSDCLWIGRIAMSGVKIGEALAADAVPDSPIVHAHKACKAVATASKSRYELLRKNIVHDVNTSMSSTGDPYMAFLFDMIQSGKVSKEPEGPITIVDASQITAKEISALYEKVKRALFSLGPTEMRPVKFDELFDGNIQQLKAYIDFMNSSDLNLVVAKDKALKTNCTKLTAAYILTKAVHDTFNGCIMTYSKNEVTMEDSKVPSFTSFCKAIDDNCKAFANTDIDRDYIFNYKMMFSTEIPYFPIEQIVKQNPSLYNLMVEYRDSCMEAYAAQAMDMLAAKNIPVKYTSGEFSESFNRRMKGVARIDEHCENLTLSTMVSSTQFADAFNAVSDGIAYAARKDVNDKETEYKLWSVLKTLANRTPEALGGDVKKEFVNVAHAQEDIMFRMNLALKAGVVVKDKGYRFSGDFGTVTNGKNVQAIRIDRIMKIFYAYAKGLLFEKTNSALATIGYPKSMSMNLVMPYLSKVYDIAKEYNIAFKKNNAKELGCSTEWSTKIISELDVFNGGENVS